jgi:glycosyltransferase involved in cell wall biosynthesis
MATASVLPNTRPAILVIHPSDELYGADRVLLTVLDAISIRVQPIVVLPRDTEPGGLSAELSARGIPVMRLPLPVVRRRYFNPIGLLRFAILVPVGLVGLVVLGRRHHVVAVHANTAVVLGTAVPARLLGAVHVWHIHELIESPRLLARIVARLTSVFSCRVVAISEAVRARIVADGGRVTDVFRNPAPPWLSRPEAGERRTVTIVGRVNGGKGHAEFVRAADVLHRTYPDVRFRVVGGPVPGRDRPYEEIRALCARLDPDGQWLKFVGWSGDVESELVAATVVALPSTFAEPLNITALEAMAVGRAVVATSVGGLPEVVVGDETGLLVPPGDVEALAGAIGRLLDDRGLRASLVAGAQARLKSEFDITVYRSAWDTLYRDVIRDCVAASPGSGRVAK